MLRVYWLFSVLLSSCSPLLSYSKTYSKPHMHGKIFPALLTCYDSGKFWHGVEDSSKWNAAIRLYMESFLEINMSAFINMLAVINNSSSYLLQLNFTTPIEKFNSVISLGLMILSIVFPLGTCFFLYINKSHFETENMKFKYGALYEMFKFDHWYHYMHHIFFFTRRMILMAILIFLGGNFIISH